MLSSTLFCLLLSVSLVSGHLLTDDRTTRRPRKGEPEERRKLQTRIQSRQQRSVDSQDECQEGNPLGASYSGRMNVTASGRTCQFWAASQPHVPKYTDGGKEERPNKHKKQTTQIGQFSGQSRVSGRWLCTW